MQVASLIKPKVCWLNSNLLIYQLLLPLNLFWKSGYSSVGLFKVNFDPAWDRSNNEVGIGVAIQDHFGEFYAGLIKAGFKALSTEVAELTIVHEAIVFS